MPPAVAPLLYSFEDDAVTCPGCLTVRSLVEPAPVSPAKRRADALPVFVGEVNPHGSRPDMALFFLPRGSAGWRLQRQVLDVPRTMYYRCPRYNLCSERWSVTRARERASELLVTHPDDIFVLLGRRVATAVGLAAAPLFSRQGRFVLLPHPSGRCREWNQLGAHARARELVFGACPGLFEGASLSGSEDVT